MDVFLFTCTSLNQSWVVQINMFFCSLICRLKRFDRSQFRTSLPTREFMVNSKVSEVPNHAPSSNCFAKFCLIWLSQSFWRNQQSPQLVEAVTQESHFRSSAKTENRARSPESLAKQAPPGDLESESRSVSFPLIGGLAIAWLVYFLCWCCAQRGEATFTSNMIIVVIIIGTPERREEVRN